MNEIPKHLEITPEVAYRLLNDYRTCPQNYMADVLQMGPIWSLQDRLLTAVPRAIKEHKPIYVASGHSLGKDFICGALALWFCWKIAVLCSMLT